jgi:hypothetical protein
VLWVSGVRFPARSRHRDCHRVLDPSGSPGDRPGHRAYRSFEPYRQNGREPHRTHIGVSPIRCEPSLDGDQGILLLDLTLACNY